MAYPIVSPNGPCGPTLALMHPCTLADFTAGGTTTPAIDDVVILSTTGNWYVKEAGDDATKRLGRIVKVELAPVSTAVGYVVVEWLDAIRVVRLATDDLSTTAIANSAITDGVGSTGNFDAGATTGPLVVAAESAASGAGTVDCIVFGA